MERSIGRQAITALPANRSVILADSRYRNQNTTDDVYNFECNLSGNAIYAKELYYQRLYWNQPLFSHNNSSVELRFQMNYDTSVTYIVYATPFLMYTEFDGNPYGTSFLPPQLNSYASNMELGLNGDIRTYPLNTTLINGDGKLRDPSGNTIVMAFRYSPSKGFAIYPVQNIAAYPAGYSIQLLPCDYIANAHFVHGFGIFSPDDSNTQYVPRSGFTAAYYSDTTPTLLPIRYVVINSPELNKDRRLISFHNGNYANFINELGVFALNRENTGAYHSQTAGEDSTVVSLRDDFTPQNFRIQIMNEFGTVLRCDDPIRNILSSYLANPVGTRSFISGALQNRGNPTFTNTIVFGTTNRIPTGVLQKFLSILQVNILTPYPNTMTNCTQYSFILPFIGQAVYLNDLAILPTDLAGLQYTGYQNFAYGPNPSCNTSLFRYYPLYNPVPFIGIDVNMTVSYSSGPTFTGPTPFHIQIDMISTTFPNPSFGTAILYQSDLQTLNAAGNTITLNALVPKMMTMNTFFNPSQVQNVFFVLSLVNTSSPPALNVTPAPTFNNYPTQILPYQFLFMTPDNTVDAQNSYRPIPTQSQEYVYGDPSADGLCEEVIHEIGAILEYN